MRSWALPKWSTFPREVPDPWLWVKTGIGEIKGRLLSIHYSPFTTKMSLKITIYLAQMCLWMTIFGQLVLPVRADTIPLDRDIPEEILRAEIITEARSPIDGRALSATEFAELVVETKQQLDRSSAELGNGSAKIKDTLFLLRLRSFLRSVGIPIK